ncbi:unnamed protein product [Adineta steineri]|uniref:Nudix hydrolase domain-containing protein n=1 Tax=Adineta steineri TaxID=433720 RepID=A0A816D5C5_9BILA|nr:unnamed protein product [Adineta steineri]CAF1379686.1 unnamed protein product [Adineta steineri]CAF1463032.1 unnamed protein product [Adineta steineri]CAF1633728.1 unnamed protein product [Adineta steineri]
MNKKNNTMKLVFSDHPVPSSITKSIFLAGPSPRDKNVIDWRHEAVSYLSSASINYDGTIFIPVPEGRFHGTDHDSSTWTYDNQISWECECRHVADLIVFWIPRYIDEGMAGFTTNVEFGEDIHSGKIVYGRPENAEKCRYLDTRMKELKLPVFTSLANTLHHAISLLGAGAYRSNGEVYVPLFIWKTQQFQSWYSNLKLVGNRLEKAKVLHHMKINNSQQVFSYILWSNIWIEAEKRYKENEFVFARTDISTILAYYKDNDDDIKIALIKEFRSPVNNSNGFVYELPGGSSFEPNVDPQLIAKHELEEECGINIDDMSRFKYVGQRQLAATLSSHQAQLYTIELTKEEYEQMLENEKSNRTFGVSEDSEKTYLKMISISQLQDSFLDFSMLGMIYYALYSNK